MGGTNHDVSSLTTGKACPVSAPLATSLEGLGQKGKYFLSQWDFAEEGWTLNFVLTSTTGRLEFTQKPPSISSFVCTWNMVSYLSVHQVSPLKGQGIHIWITQLWGGEESVYDSGYQTNMGWYYFHQNGLFCFVCPCEYISFSFCVSQLSIVLSHNCNKREEPSKLLILTRTRVGPTTLIQIPCKSLSKFTAKVWWEFWHFDAKVWWATLHRLWCSGNESPIGKQSVLRTMW